MEEARMIPLATTTIEIRRLAASEDGYDPPSDPPEVVVSAVRAHLSAPTGAETLAGGAKERIDRHLDCDPVDVRQGDQVVDLTDEAVYVVAWSHLASGLGLDRTEAGLRLVTGLA
jgi:hypothetical protein